MIVNFSIQNFGPIKEKQTLSFEADKSEHLEDYYVIHKNGLRLLKLGLIYGANASGKTTVLDALDFLQTLVLYPKNQKNETFSFEPFLFDSKTPKQNTVLNLDFIQNDVRYFYEVEFNRNFIVSEKLSFTKNSKSTRKTNVFKRTTDAQKQLTNIIFDSKIEMQDVSLKTLVTNTLWNNTVLGGFQRTNIDSKELTDVKNWFVQYLNPVIYTPTNLSNFIAERVDTNVIDSRAVFNIIKKADFNLSNIILKKENKKITQQDIALLVSQKFIKEDNIQDLKNRTLTTVNLEFEHTVKGTPYTLNFNKESQGTRRYYGFAGLLYLLIKNSTLFPIDELESSLHPDLFEHFLLSFLVNSKESQLIATTHNREILNNKDIFRNDAIWITDKDNEYCATELYSLADFDSTVIRNTSNVLNAYKLGRLGGTPNLGDYYIDIEEDEEK